MNSCFRALPTTSPWRAERNEIGMAVALIVAAGSGERLGAECPKAFVLLGGRPMIEWSIEALQAVPAVTAIVVALPPGAAAPRGTVGVLGGASRCASVAAALAVAPFADEVIVHDAARPLASTQLFVEALEQLKKHACDAVVAAAPLTDTVKEVGHDGEVRRTLDRSTLWAVQTPQVFRRAALEAALSGSDDELAAATDDASLVEAAGGRVRVVAAPRENLKVTTALDLQVAQLLLAERVV